jgi:glycosyltransferase involved in cell wall biosynthesis
MARLRVCVCTSYSVSVEPRAPRHAVAVANLSDEIEVVFIDCIPQGQPRITPRFFEGVRNLEYRTNYYPYRGAGRARLLFEKMKYWRSRQLYRAFGSLRAGALSTRAMKLEGLLLDAKADVYMGYNIDALVPVSRAAARVGAVTVFDCQEFYSDMGQWQTELDKELIRSVERKYLPACDMVLAASDEMADELVRFYGIKRPLPLYNVPPLQAELPMEKIEGFNLYWRNSSINLSSRGLGDGLAALSLLPPDINLHVQGRLSEEGRGELARRTRELGINERVIVHSPYEPHEAINAASRYTVGLCLEQSGCRNHDVTVSNKMFDYMMAGLPVVASDLPGLRDVVTRSGGGLLFESGKAEDLAAKILMLYRDRELLDQTAGRARGFALREGNLDAEMKKLQDAFSALVNSKMKVERQAIQALSI